MTSSLVHLVKWNYQQILNETVTDPLVDSWFLMGSFWPVATLTAGYLYFVLIFGPQMMENRKPYNLNRLLVVYNLYQVIFSTWLCVKVMTSEGVSDSILQCKSLERNTRLRDLLHEGAWYYFFSKVVELLDTIFFVLRKKQRQITFLHVYHHANMVVSTWAYLKYIPGEQGLVIGFLNSIVHIVMYGYYCLAALGPRFEKYLWWKKHLTKLQLVQFVLMMLYLVLLLVNQCKVPKAMSIYMLVNAAIFLGLFLNFYYKSYNEKENAKRQKKVE
ncbi:hypothetical protein LSTR_LSTR004257 [Laodelphax striatellus]|uniref:Elongation of very long chain fatty acids protein n=1 Tax=Laodelphax striatellus TaxID=195883 RepID=A0A482XAF9_LAOST|nr:hypothetical protein LSTR_LSTR004257 [Laodelphax striatellus]